jgi:deoxyhypusine synthase
MEMRKGKKQFFDRPVQHLAPRETQTLLDLVKAFEHTSFQSRNIYKCFDVFSRMLDDPRCIVFMGLSGALIPGGMRKILRDLIDLNLVDVIVSTGANMFHDLFEGNGYRHFIGSEAGDDDLLRRHRVVRVYDALMDDGEINKVIRLLSRVPDELEGREVSSREYLNVLGRHVEDEESILATASRKGVPVFVPALCDSSIGIGLTFLHGSRKGTGKRFVLDQIRDNYEIAQIRKLGRVTGAIYVGGGVPKNYIQQLGPVSELLFRKESVHQYAFQLTTDDPKWGGLSGCTFEEAKSWGKIGKTSAYACAYIDATIGLPLLVGAVLQARKDRPPRKQRRFVWEGERLKSIKLV